MDKRAQDDHHGTSRVPDFWRRRSLKFWLAAGMFTAVLPLAISALANHLLTKRHIVEPMVSVAAQNRLVVQPLHDIQLDLWEIANLAAGYAAADDNGRAAPTFAALAADVHVAFLRLEEAVAKESKEATAIRQARDQWATASTRLRNFFAANAAGRGTSAARDIEAIDKSLGELNHLVGLLADGVRKRGERVHDEVLSTLAATEHAFEIAFGASVVMVALGILIINKSLVTSMEELADGALRVAAGDREHRVEVQIPTEMARVASAFNTMTTTIIDQEKALHLAARTDGLTGLLNRREFDHALEEEVRRTQRYGQPTSLIMIDIDHFKQFNDRYGHQGGDEALRFVARSIRRAVRDIDMVCRFGGEELAAILPSADTAAARVTAERIRAAVEGTDIGLGDNVVAKATISLGVAAAPEHGSDAETLLRAADLALYASKSDGRNRVSVASAVSA